MSLTPFRAGLPDLERFAIYSAQRDRLALRQLRTVTFWSPSTRSGAIAVSNVPANAGFEEMILDCASPAAQTSLQLDPAGRRPFDNVRSIRDRYRRYRFDSRPAFRADCQQLRAYGDAASRERHRHPAGRPADRFAGRRWPQSVRVLDIGPT
jgi:hypothetical protein